MTLIYLFLGLVVLGLLLQSVVWLRVAAMRRAGVYPASGQATMSDVERLVRAGQRVWAIRCYREIHHCGLAEAKKGVDDLHIAA